jgi:CRP-like cAMP-binding protein
MVSPELIRRYPFFANLSMEQIVTLAQAADELEVPPEHYFFRVQEELDHFYVVLEGQVGIQVNLTDERVSHSLSQQLTGDLKTREVVVTKIGPGEVFAWSALVPPHTATSSGKALTQCRVIAFGCRELRPILEEDCQFGYMMLQKATQVIRDRMRDLRIEILSDLVAHPA